MKDAILVEKMSEANPEWGYIVLLGGFVIFLIFVGIVLFDCYLKYKKLKCNCIHVEPKLQEV